MDTNIEIYVRLLGEGTVVYRPATGVRQDDGTFLLQAPRGYDEEDELWEFLPGSIVRCEKKLLEGKFMFLACELA